MAFAPGSIILVASCYLLIGLIATPDCHAGKAVRVLFDDAHGQQAGNADWTITGAYSEFADLLRDHNYIVKNLRAVSPEGIFHAKLLKRYKVVILPEPNTLYSRSEELALRQFVANGGGLFMIADHGGSDRDFDGADSSIVLSSLAGPMGLAFIGDDFSAAPVSGCTLTGHPLLHNVSAVAAFAATTIEALTPDEQVQSLLEYRADGGAYLVGGSYHQGRFVGVGDSSIFDDGVGAQGNKLHESFKSPLYDHDQLALNIICWLHGRTAPTLPRLALGNSIDICSKAQRSNVLLIDAAHGNSSADKVTEFTNDLSAAGYTVCFLQRPWTESMLKTGAGLLLMTPYLEITEAEIATLRGWVHEGGLLVAAASSDKVVLTNRVTLNRMLAGIDSTLRFNSDEILDETNNSDQPWGVLVQQFGATVDCPGLKTLMTWGGCSLITASAEPVRDTDRISVISLGDADTISRDSDQKGDAIMLPPEQRVVLGAVEKVGKGRVLCLGSAHFTDYQYPSSPMYPREFTKVEHQTPQFNLWLLTSLLKEVTHEAE